MGEFFGAILRSLFAEVEVLAAVLGLGASLVCAAGLGMGGEMCVLSCAGVAGLAGGVRTLAVSIFWGAGTVLGNSLAPLLTPRNPLARSTPGLTQRIFSGRGGLKKEGIVTVRRATTSRTWAAVTTQKLI